MDAERRWSGGALARITLLRCVVLIGSAALGACDQSLPNVPSRVVLPEATIVHAADRDNTMGALSDVAQHIAAALQDPRIRGMVVRALRDTVNNGTGMDLAQCSPGTIVGDLLTAGELRGGQSAASLCERMKSKTGMILYMDHSRLMGWDSTTIPIVTAVADPNAPIAKTFHGYFTPTTMADLRSDGSVNGPVLVVLPIFHPRRVRDLNRAMLPTNVIVRPAPARGTIFTPRPVR
jgi:hypothetical protein